MNLIDADIARIIVSNNRRRCKPSVVKAIADSIIANGLLHPIGVVANGDEYRLVHGRHRLEAYVLLGYTSIPAIVHEMDDLHADLAEIDENIQRNQLTALEEADALKRRKEIYLALHPETKQGGDHKTESAKSKRQNVVSFADDTAAKTGKSKRTVERNVELAEKISDAAKVQLHGTPVADNKAELKKLAELPEAKQLEVAQKIASGKAKTVAAAVGKTPTTDDDPETADEVAQLREECRLLAHRLAGKLKQLGVYETFSRAFEALLKVLVVREDA